MSCKNCGKCSICAGNRRKLSELHPGESGKIVSVGGEGNLRTRILDMGLTKGAVVRIVKKAPLGDPLELQVRGYALSIRKKEAEMIEVER